MPEFRALLVKFDEHKLSRRHINISRSGSRSIIGTLVEKTWLMMFMSVLCVSVA